MHILISKILSSIFTIATAATAAFTSAGNKIQDYSQNFFNPKPPQNQKIDLKVDSQCHYYQFDPGNPASYKSGDLTGYFDAGCQGFGNWEERDLTDEKFFNFSDLKPGDQGEDTISLHITGNQTCGRMEIFDIKDQGNTCTEPETDSNDRDCKNKAPGSPERNGELWDNLEFRLWLDQGEITGFQGKDQDPLEGDNIFNGKDILIFDWRKMGDCPKTIPLWNALRRARLNDQRFCDNANKNKDGDTRFGKCHGLPGDGHLVKDATYYYGLAWRFPESVGNEAQDDSASFSLRFRVVPDERCTSCYDPCDSCHKKCSDCEDRCQECDRERQCGCVK